MSQPKRLLIVLADGEHVRFVRPGPDHVLRTDSALDSVTAHKRSSDLGTARPGSTAHHGLTPRHDLHHEAELGFGHEVAALLNDPATGATFDSLLVVAPAHTLNAIRDKLTTATAACLVATLGKDLVKTPDHELAPHLFPWVRQAA